jgi:hypothetical protein
MVVGWKRPIQRASGFQLAGYGRGESLYYTLIVIRAPKTLKAFCHSNQKGQSLSSSCFSASLAQHSNDDSHHFQRSLRKRTHWVPVAEYQRPYHGIYGVLTTTEEHVALSVEYPEPPYSQSSGRPRPGKRTRPSIYQP